MKNLKKIISALALLAAFSCSKVQHGEDGSRITFQVVTDQDLIDPTKSDVSGSFNVSDFATLPSANDFTLSVVNSTTQETVWEGNLGGWPADKMLPAGSYSVTASYGSLEDEGFGKPYFTTGMRNSAELPDPVEFAIVGGDEPVVVQIPVVLGNTLVRFACSDVFANYYKDYSFSIVRDQKTIAEFSKADIEAGKAVFLNGYRFSVAGKMVSPNGTSLDYKGESDFSALKPATIYTLNIDLDNVGWMTPDISIELEEDLADEDLGDFELNEE